MSSTAIAAKYCLTGQWGRKPCKTLMAFPLPSELQGKAIQVKPLNDLCSAVRKYAPVNQLRQDCSQMCDPWRANIGTNG